MIVFNKARWRRGATPTVRRPPPTRREGPPKDNVVFLGPPGTGKTHLAIGLAIRACQAGHRVLFATAAEWVARLAEAHHAGRLPHELTKLGRYPLLVVDEVGYVPSETALGRDGP